MIEIEGLTTRARDGRRTLIIDRATFTVPVRGDVVAIVGPNGAGKTTLLESILGLRAYESGGSVRFEGSTLASFRSRADVFAYMPDEATLPEEASVKTILQAAAADDDADDANRYEDVARRFGVDAFLDRGAGQLSRGESKRVWLAMTVLQNRPVLVLDEPFGAFDPLQLDAIIPAVKESVRRNGGIALVTIHQLSIAERIADRIVILSQGRVLAEGTLEELRQRQRELEPKADPNCSLEEIFRSLLQTIPTTSTPPANDLLASA